MVGARIKIMWEEQLFDPQNEFLIPRVSELDIPSVSY